jgi:PIN domain nuclease of toxin-antitoxin system
MGAVVVDSSVVLGWLDPGDAHYERATQTLGSYFEGGAEFALPASVMSEVLVAQARLASEPVEQRRAELIELFGPVRVIDEEVAVRAARLRAKHRALRLPDALVIAVGMVDDADAILTADKRWAAVDSRVTVLS